MSRSFTPSFHFEINMIRIHTDDTYSEVVAEKDRSTAAIMWRLMCATKKKERKAAFLAFQFLHRL